MWTFGSGPRMCVGHKFIHKILKVCISCPFYVRHATIVVMFSEKGLKNCASEVRRGEYRVQNTKLSSGRVIVTERVLQNGKVWSVRIVGVY